ncbi:hypothetical protein B0H10DRAFT_1954801 [Mycena sp. CBHHK59/15]|nr:hypothetical protein B0H10DRAFT_1954801 [Mycena sp. CBHHK59/15]
MSAPVGPAPVCADCGLVFKNLGANRSNCFKCEKRAACGQDSIALAAVEVSLTSLPSFCLLGARNVVHAKPQPANAVIELDGDSDVNHGSDSDIQEVTEMNGLKAKIRQQQHAASGFRLTQKGVVDSNPSLHYRGSFFRNGTRPGHTAQTLQRLLAFSSKFTSSCKSWNMERVFQKMVDMVNEPDSQWSDVQFTFKDGMDIPYKYRSASCSVATFWTAHSQLHNQFFKKASIVASMAEINMLVPAQLTKYDDLSDEDPDMFDAILGTKRGHRNLKSSGSSRKKVKQEPEDSGFVFKSEPIEKKVPRTWQHQKLSHGDAQYLARRLDNIEFQFAPDAELDSARAELDRGHWFKAVLQKLTSNYSFDVPELIKYTTPDLFIATVKEQGTILGHLICQPKPTTPSPK